MNDQYCPTCGELMDTHCVTGLPRCDTCGPPCSGCYDLQFDDEPEGLDDEDYNDEEEEVTL